MIVGMISQKAVEQALRDSGCDETIIKEYFSLAEKGCIRKQLNLLSAHRKCLLDQIHREERQIECLDYLVYQIQKEAEKK